MISTWDEVDASCARAVTARSLNLRGHDHLWRGTYAANRTSNDANTERNALRYTAHTTHHYATVNFFTRKIIISIIFFLMPEKLFHMINWNDHSDQRYLSDLGLTQAPCFASIRWFVTQFRYRELSIFSKIQIFEP